MTWPTALLIALLAAASAHAADGAAGEAVFARCKICHQIAANPGNAVGPNLHGVFGRKAGTYDHFDYSHAMKASGIVWNTQTIGAFVRDPQGFMPGTRMAFPGIQDARQIADLLAYLKTAAR